jgi:ABC-type multidrug transport system ATPase subunit
MLVLEVIIINIDYKPSEIEPLVDSKLKDVNLVTQGNSEVRTYSGGMKRRLSILLSTIGNPRVVFLDEPTTGLDPVNRRFIWTMIQDIKKDKSVILTTHSMEEADFLSDRIGVIVDGNFKCIGTPLDIKKTFGGGYLLTFGKFILTQYAIMRTLK